MAQRGRAALAAAVLVLAHTVPPTPLIVGAFCPRSRPLLGYSSAGGAAGTPTAATTTTRPTVAAAAGPRGRSMLPVLFSSSNLSSSDPAVETRVQPALAPVQPEAQPQHSGDGPILITPTFNSSSVDGLILRAMQDIEKLVSLESQLQRRAQDDVSKLLELDKAAKSRARADVDIVWKSAGTEPLVQRILGAGEELLSWVRWQVDRNARGDVAGLDWREELQPRGGKGGPGAWRRSQSSEDLLSDMQDWRNIYFGLGDDEDEAEPVAREIPSNTASSPSQSSPTATSQLPATASELDDFPLCDGRADEEIAWFWGVDGHSSRTSHRNDLGSMSSVDSEDDLMDAFGAIYDPSAEAMDEDEEEADEMMDEKGKDPDEGDVFELVDTVIAGKWRRRKQADGKEEIYFDPSSSEVDGRTTERW